MNSIAKTLGLSVSDHPLRLRFLKWQCHVRQMAMRDLNGMPSEAITPAVFLPGEAKEMGHIITVLNKSPAYSVTAEMNFMRTKTNDPAQIRESAIQFLSATYYQKAAEFSDILTATFPPGSPGAQILRDAAQVQLVFEAYSQRYEITCKVWRLAAHNPLQQATIAHNALFNPALHPDTEVLGFEPDWEQSKEILPGDV